MRKWWPLVTICLGTFMLLIDVTIVNVPPPQVSGDLKTSFNSLQWVVDGYALSLGVLLLGAGALGDMFGHRRLYVGGLVLFAVASLNCGGPEEAADGSTPRGGPGGGGDVPHDLRAAQQLLSGAGARGGVRDLGWRLRRRRRRRADPRGRPHR